MLEALSASQGGCEIQCEPLITDKGRGMLPGPGTQLVPLLVKVVFPVRSQHHCHPCESGPEIPYKAQLLMAARIISFWSGSHLSSCLG